MQGLSFTVIMFIMLLGSLHFVLSDGTSSSSLPTEADADFMDLKETEEKTLPTKKNKYYNVLLRRRSHTTKEFYAYVDKVRGMHMDPNRPKFRAEIVKVLINMKTLTVKNPTKNALKFFNSNRDIVDMVTEEEKDIEAEL